MIQGIFGTDRKPGHTKDLWLSHAIYSPNDASEYFWGGRWSQAPEIGANFNNAIICPNYKIMWKSVEATWRCANTPDQTVPVRYYLNVWTPFPDRSFKFKREIMQSPVTIPSGMTMWGATNSFTGIVTNPLDIIMISTAETWPVTNPSNWMVTMKLEGEVML